MKIPTAQQIKELDALTIEHESISSIDLMERAACEVVLCILAQWDSHVPVVIFAGPGNNGGDALAVARLLSEKQYKVTAFLFNINNKLSEDCQINKERLQRCPNVDFTEVSGIFEAPELNEKQLIVDGLFGTGLSRALHGGFASLVKLINASNAPVVSIDMPSGLMSEDNSNNVRVNIVRATQTLTFQLPKLAQLLTDNQPFVGKLRILDIGLSDEAMRNMDTEWSITEKSEMRAILKSRNPFGHKGTFGHALLIAGKYGMAGASVLAARACLRCGVGKVTVHTPYMNNDILQISLPEAILSHDLNGRIYSQVIPTDSYNAVGIGPALGTASETASAFIEQLRKTRSPLVVDADGLNILGAHKGWIPQIPKGAILTPHPLEFRRLSERSDNSYSMIMGAREMSMQHGLYLVLKGHHTAVCSPDGRVYFNPTGNSGMATAGSGDVLTGMITALLAQNYSALEACRLGVYLHGLAGDLAARNLGESSVIASDIIRFIPKAFLDLQSKDSYQQS